MSVLVRDMKISKNCMDCPLFESLYHYHGCHAKPESFNDRDMWNFAVSDRPSWCPLVEVPTPHGRLIDADDFEKRIKMWTDHPNDYIRQRNQDMLYYVQQEATVIEAEDGEA